ncbi:MAG: hypothetical protein ACI92E_002889 [Oceanicoccus sp.]|jgi:hypothetical protein
MEKIANSISKEDAESLGLSALGVKASAADFNADLVVHTALHLDFFAQKGQRNEMLTLHQILMSQVDQLLYELKHLPRVPVIDKESGA